MIETPWPILFAGFMVAVGAGVVRGFAGFGFSALTVAGVSLFVAPATIVPAVLALEVAASLGLARGSLRHVERDWMTALLLGNAIFIPVGIVALVALPQTWVRMLVGLALLLGAVLTKAAGRRTLAPTAGLRLLASVASGLLNGVAASGGVAAALLMAAARLPPAALRGTMIIFLLFTGVYAIVCAGVLSQGPIASTQLLGIETLRWALLFGPAMFIGIALGRRAFGNTDPARYRAFVLNLLMVIASFGVLRSGIDLLRA